MTLKKARRIGWMPIISGIVALLLIAIVVIEAISNRTKSRVDVSEGLALIEAAQGADVAAIELKIQSLDAQDELGGGRSLKEIFASSVIMGDSMAQGFAEYDILNASSVVADIGVSLTDLNAQIERVREINPQYIFMTYGANDILTTNGDVDLFIEQYRNALREIQAQLPNTRVLVNSLFPVQGETLEKYEAYQYVGEYNQALQELCDRLQITFIDNTEIVKSTDYEADGLHLKSLFYPGWAVHMAEVTSL